MSITDIKFIELLSPRLEKFKKVKSNTYNCRCPICGDSKKNKNKARGYFYSIGNNINYKCHNCGVNISFSNFLKKIDFDLYKEYNFEKFKKTTHQSKSNLIEKRVIKKIRDKKYNINLPLASYNQKSREYLLSRKLNPNKFYYCKQFKSWINSIKGFDYFDLKYDEERIIIPLIFKGNLIGVQGRALNISKIKYITIMFNESFPKVYNYDNLNFIKPIYILEGPFDSEFVDNSIAMCGADLNLKDLNLTDVIWIYDNEPRNEEIISRIERKIEEGEKVVIWPSNLIEKDINEMVINNVPVQQIIQENTYSNLKAKLQFTYWKKL